MSLSLIPAFLFSWTDMYYMISVLDGHLIVKCSPLTTDSRIDKRWVKKKIFDENDPIFLFCVWHNFASLIIKWKYIYQILECAFVYLQQWHILFPSITPVNCIWLSVVHCPTKNENGAYWKNFPHTLDLETNALWNSFVYWVEMMR